MIPRMWREEPFTYKGEYWSVEHPVSVIPKPVQKPHPPMWVACTNPTTFELAGERGLGALCFTLGVELRDVAPRIRLYRDTIKRAKPVGQSINNQVSLIIMGVIDDDPKKAEDLAHDSVLWYVRRGFTLVSSVAEAKSKVTDIAMDCGFRNLANFNRHFRSLTKLSPREYRSRFRETAG